MMHVDDIEEALAERDYRAIESAFRALVDAANLEEIGGAETVETLASLLHRVTAAMTDDTAMVPRATAHLIEEIAGSCEVMRAYTYAEAAMAVTLHSSSWRALYLRHMSGGTL